MTSYGWARPVRLFHSGYVAFGQGPLTCQQVIKIGAGHFFDCFDYHPDERAACKTARICLFFNPSLNKPINCKCMISIAGKSSCISQPAAAPDPAFKQTGENNRRWLVHGAADLLDGR